MSTDGEKTKEENAKIIEDLPLQTALKNEIPMPENCGSCEYSEEYDRPYFSHHWCCELVYRFCSEDYRVDPTTIDDYCPLKNEKLREAIAEVKEHFFSQFQEKL